MAAEPYVGPRPFEAGDGDRFFGRDRETADLISLTFAHAAVLLYSQSGAGKTSLLQARLLPRLAEKGFEVLPTVRIRVLGSEDGSWDGKDNPYVRNVLRSCAGDGASARRAGVSIREALGQRPHRLDDLGEPIPRVLVFDQLEEVFTTGPWQARREFFRQLGEALDADPLLRTLFSLREEYLAHLDPYAALMPERLRCRFRLELLRRPAALKAVVGPLEGRKTRFADGVAEALVTNLMRVKVQSESGDRIEEEGEFAEPVQLQVVCQGLWRELPEGTAEITHDHLRDLGDVDEALIGFFERCLRETVEETAIQEGRLRGWFEKELITPSGTRGMVHQGKEETGGIPNAVVEKLERLHLIRGDWRAGAPWYELTHDRFIEPIRESNRRWREELGIAEQTRLRLEERARQWKRGGGEPLDEVDLRDAERCLAAAGREEIGASEALLSLVDASRARLEQKRLYQLLWVAALAVVMLSGLVVWTWVTEVNDEKENRIDQSEQLAEAALAAGVASPSRGLLLAVEAARMARKAGQAHPPAAESTLRELLERSAGSRAEPASFVSRPAVAVDPTGHWLATFDPSDHVHLWELGGEGSAPRARRLSADRDRIQSGAFLRDGRRLVTVALRRVLLWDLSSSSRRTLWEGATDLEDVSFAPGARWLFLQPRGEQALLLDLEPPRGSPRSRPLPLSGLRSPAFVGPGGDWLASWSGTGTELAWLWDLSAGGQPAQIGLGEHRGIFHAAFSPSGRWLATTERGGLLRLWDLRGIRNRAPGAPVEPIRTYQHGGGILALAFSPDDRWLAAASEDRSVSVWNLSFTSFSMQESFRLVSFRPRLLYEPDGPVTALAISRDGWLATGTGGGGKATVRLIRLFSAGLLDSTRTWTARDHGLVHAIHFSPDSVPGSRWLLTVGNFRVLRWSLRLDDLLDLACRRAGRNLTEQEWRQFFPGEEYRETCPVPSDPS